jgi:hypothetical protein
MGKNGRFHVALAIALKDCLTVLLADYQRKRPGNPGLEKIADKSTGAYNLGFYFNNCLDLLNEVRTACRFS